MKSIGINEIQLLEKEKQQAQVDPRCTAALGRTGTLTHPNEQAHPELVGSFARGPALFTLMNQLNVLDCLISSLLALEMGSTAASPMAEVGVINQLPEDCISHVISFTTPRDACVSSAVSRSLRSAADSDATWQRFLPSDYATILSRAVDPVGDGSKKELYFRLCDHPVLINGGSMSFGLDKSSGAKCFMLSARALSIVWGQEPRYWHWIALPDSRFNECAELNNVCWLEICGKLDSKVLTPNTSYIAYLIYKLGVHARGLSNPFQKAKITISGITMSQHSVCIHRRERERSNPWQNMHWLGGPAEEMTDEVRLPRERQDGWLEVDLGEFYSGDGIDGEVGLSLMEIEGGHWKRGLIVQGIEVRPKH